MEQLELNGSFDLKSPTIPIIILKAFCMVSPNSVISHLKTLHPYLQSQKTDFESGLVYQNVAHIVQNLVPLLKNEDKKFLDSLTQDLMKLLYSQGMPVIQSCTQAICEIVNLTRNFNLVENIYQNFFNYLQKVQLKSKEEQNTAQLSIIRALFILGQVCKNHKFYKAQGANPKTKDPHDDHIEKVFKQYLYFIEHENMSIRVVALMGLVMLFGPYPTFIGRAESIMWNCLSATSHVRLRTQILVSFLELMKEESECMHTSAQENIKNSQNSDTSHVNYINGEKGASTTIITKFFSKILEQFLDTNPNIRLLAVNLVNYVLKKRYIHPVQCIEHMLALTTDQVKVVSDRAFVGLTTIVQHDAKLVLNRIRSGTLFSYKFQMDVFGVSRATVASHDGSESVFGRIYSLFKNKTEKHNFLSVLAHLFTDSENTHFLSYLSSLIASLHFSFQDEVLCIYHQLVDLIKSSGAVLISQLDSSMEKSPLQLSPKQAKLLTSTLYALNLKCYLSTLYDTKQPLKENKPKPVQSKGVTMSPEETLLLLNQNIPEDPTNSKIDQIYAKFKEQMGDVDLGMEGSLGKRKRSLLSDLSPRKKRIEIK
uniref:Sister chromatid cohesion protein n=1 Tax=Arcella intermedia TaxID=1963864 RepID=A0A6B2L021_9EUKA